MEICARCKPQDVNLLCLFSFTGIRLAIDTFKLVPSKNQLLHGGPVLSPSEQSPSDHPVNRDE